MKHAERSKTSRKSSWLPLLLGGAFAALAAQSCSVDKGKYTFVPDDQFAAGGLNNGGNGGAANGGGAHAGGAQGGGTSAGNAGGGEANAGEANAGDGNAGDAGAPGTGACTPGEHACTPDGHLQTCQGGPAPAFDAGKACGAAGKCSASLGICLKCVPGEFQCASNVLQQCNIFGSAFEDTEACASVTSCVGSGQKGYCVRCKPGVAACEATLVHVLASPDDSAAYPSNHLVTCNAEGSGTDTSQVCVADSPVCDPVGKSCLNCAPNSLFCDGNGLDQCSADGTNYSFKQNCPTGNTCDAATASCVRLTGCTPGTYQCLSASLQSCNRAGQWETLDTCDSKDQCDPSNGRCQKCVANSYSCVNDAVQRCDFNNGDFKPYVYETCNPGTCVPTGATSFPNCQPRVGTTSCYDGSPSYTTYLAGAPVTTQCMKDTVSGVTQVCNSQYGKCAACVPGTYSCENGTLLKQCAADGSAWSVVKDCQVTGQQCDAGRGLCLDAQAGRYFCADNGDVTEVTYDARHNLTSKVIEQCGSKNLCNGYDGTCRRRQCVIGQTTCSGPDVYSCDGTSDRRMRSGTRCSSAARCQDGFGCVKVLGLAAGDAHTCAIVAGADAVEGAPGYVMCWGANESGQLGDGSPLLADSKEPRQVLVSPGPGGQGGGASGSAIPRLSNYFSGVCAGKNFTCAELVIPDAAGAGRVACWGSNAKGQLGAAYADPGPYNGPFQGVTDSAANDKGIDLHGVTCGAEFACALGPDGKPWCWGANESGQLGNGAAGAPGIAAAGIDGFAFTQISAGARHVCASKADGTVWCWGDGSSGQLGTGALKGLATPTLLGTVATAPDRPLALGNDFSLALSGKASKNPFAWGSNTFGQLTNAGQAPVLSPGVLAGLLSSDLLDTGTLYSGATAEHACARILDRLYCWGANVFGEVGDGTTIDRSSPVAIFDGKTALTRLAPGRHSVALGGRHTCAITAQGDVLCWGANHRYQLGTSAITPQRVPLKAY
jgi:alpha-tubulin suppressor-like RCC1 family protein